MREAGSVSLTVGGRQVSLASLPDHKDTSPACHRQSAAPGPRTDGSDRS